MPVNKIGIQAIDLGMLDSIEEHDLLLGWR